MPKDLTQTLLLQQQDLRWCKHILVVQPLPDDFVHAGVGEEGLIKLIVAPLPVAQQVHNDVPAELALVLHSQSCGTDNFLRIVPVHMDNCTSNDFTCPGIQNTTVITPNPFQRKQTHTCSTETTDSPCEVTIIKQIKKDVLCDESWGKERRLAWENMQLAQPVVFVSLSTTSLQAFCSQRAFYTQFLHHINLVVYRNWERTTWLLLFQIEIEFYFLLILSYRYYEFIQAKSNFLSY